MKSSRPQRLRFTLEGLRRRLFGARQSDYRCLTCRLPFSTPIDENVSGTTNTTKNEDKAVDYDVPAFLRKASKKPEEPWPDLPQDSPNFEGEKGCFIFVPLADGTTHVVTIPGKRREGNQGYVW